MKNDSVYYLKKIGEEKVVNFLTKDAPYSKEINYSKCTPKFIADGMSMFLSGVLNTRNAEYEITHRRNFEDYIELNAFEIYCKGIHTYNMRIDSNDLCDVQRRTSIDSQADNWHKFVYKNLTESDRENYINDLKEYVLTKLDKDFAVCNKYIENINEQ